MTIIYRDKLKLLLCLYHVKDGQGVDKWKENSTLKFYDDVLKFRGLGIMFRLLKIADELVVVVII